VGETAKSRKYTTGLQSLVADATIKETRGLTRSPPRQRKDRLTGPALQVLRFACQTRFTERSVPRVVNPTSVTSPRHIGPSFSSLRILDLHL
jgi:hypothetical protein